MREKARERVKKKGWGSDKERNMHAQREGERERESKKEREKKRQRERDTHIARER